VKKTSIYTIAKAAGVSPATVSHVYTDPATVSKTTVRNVLELAEHVGFTPSAVARAAFGEATRSIGVMTSTVFNELAQSIQDRLIQADYLPILISMEGPATDAVSRMLKHNVDGLILGVCDERLDFPDICSKQMRRLPTVILETKRPKLQADSVLNDDYGGGLQAARLLLKLGHRHFGALKFGEDIISNSMDRIHGFRDAVESAGGVLDENYILGLQCTPETTLTRNDSLIRDIRQAISTPDAPTAFFCTTDYLALLFCKAAQLEKKKIPQDFSIIGFGNLDFSQYLTVPLTTLRQGIRELGTSAAELILKRIQDPERPMEHISVPVELIVRESTAKPKKET